MTMTLRAVDRVVPTPALITKTIKSFAEKLDVADQEPAGIAAIIYQMGMRLGRGKPIGNVNTFCTLLVRETPKRQWNAPRRSECRTLIRRYWAIKDTQELLQHANKSAGYYSILSVFRIASKQKLSIEEAVREYQEADNRPMHLHQLLVEVQGIASRADLSLINHYEQGRDIVLILRRASRPRSTTPK